MTDEERDTLLLDLKSSIDGLVVRVDSLEIYVKAIANRLLSPSEIAALEATNTDYATAI